MLKRDEKICNELLYGRVGYAFALLFVRFKISRDLIPDILLIDVTLCILNQNSTILIFNLFKLFNIIIDSGEHLSKSRKINEKTPLMFEWHEKKYIGAAHGLCGILYTLLSMAIDTGSRFTKQVTTLILPAINFLMTLKYDSGNYKSSLESDRDKLVQFCHGSPGMEYLFNLAYKVVFNLS